LVRRVSLIGLIKSDVVTLYLKKEAEFLKVKKATPPLEIKKEF